MSKIPQKPPPEEKPPFFRTWNYLYGFVLLFLVLLVLFFNWLTHLYS